MDGGCRFIGSAIRKRILSSPPSISALPNESPPALLLRAHQHAKTVLPKLLVEYREAKSREAADSNKNIFLRQQAESDPFIGEDTQLTRGAFAGRGAMEPEQPARIDAWGNVIQS
jgi:hypothetical protein